VVTGHDASGRGVVASDGPAVVSRKVAEADPVGPFAYGTRLRVAVMGPGTRSPMHRTGSVDYEIVLGGTLTLVLDGEETPVSAADFRVQRGTERAWENRGGEVVRMLFVLLDGRSTTRYWERFRPTSAAG
jgi:quercetin dioxygenase-like cupin family protein